MSEEYGSEEGVSEEGVLERVRSHGQRREIPEWSDGLTYVRFEPRTPFGKKDIFAVETEIERFRDVKNLLTKISNIVCDV